jgi:putative citrate transport
MDAGPPSPWALLPFVAMLLAVALGPVLAPHWWESNLNRLIVSSVLAAPVVALYRAGPAVLVHAVEEYAAFVILLGGLYAIAGGLQLRGDLVATPLTNTAFLAAGSVLASLVGTTNCGGMLTPLGDPPLFLGYLQGVPFAWTLRLWKAWLFLLARSSSSAGCGTGVSGAASRRQPRSPTASSSSPCT